MTKEELLQKLSEIEWDDFECKAALDKLPDGGYVLRSYPDTSSHLKQRYYLPEKGLKLVK